MMRYAPLRVDTGALEQYRALFAACFPGVGKFSTAYLQWLYADNPDGHAVGYDAWDGERLAAHYVCIPARVAIEGEEVMLLLSLNTATHPDYQGQGLFTRLAGMTYEAAGAAGYHGVYGVANANSTPGFVRKLGFQLVRPLEALVGIGPLRGRPAGTAPLSFERRWSAASLAWRCASPGLPVCAKQAGAGWRLDAAALPFIRVYGELPALAADGTGATAMLARHGASSGFAPLRLYLGLRPEQEQRANAYMAIPARLRPSPLNLIYRPLSVPAQQLDAARIRFTFLDFDAY